MASKSQAKAPERKTPRTRLSASAKPQAGIDAPKRRKVDWDAVERDYRSTQMTLRELGAKHGCDHAAISRKAKDNDWKRDLTAAVRQATNTMLIEAAVTNAVTNSQQAVTSTVIAVAEMNKQVILGHRRDIQDTRNVAASLLDELTASKMLVEEQDLLVEILAGEGADPVDISRARAVVKKALDLGARVSSVKALAETFTKLQVMERVAFSLDDDKPNETDKAVRMTDAERAVRIFNIMNRVQP